MKTSPYKHRSGNTLFLRFRVLKSRFFCNDINIPYAYNNGIRDKIVAQPDLSTIVLFFYRLSKFLAIMNFHNNNLGCNESPHATLNRTFIINILSNIENF